ncbi:MAG: hypothetical protein J6S14_00375, partial [Clostridia bacterium]|nr:hypothetical protein [Clostridia bacterium]
GIILTLLAFTAIGAATGAAVNTVTYVVSTPTEEFSWRDLGAEAIGGAVSGGVVGLGSGVTLLTGGSAAWLFGVSTFAGALGGLAGQFTENAIKGENLKTDLISSMVWGGISGAFFGATDTASMGVKQIAKAKGRTIETQIFKMLKYKVLKKIGTISAENLLTGFTSWYTEECIKNYYNNIKTLA